MGYRFISPGDCHDGERAAVRGELNSSQSNPLVYLRVYFVSFVVNKIHNGGHGVIFFVQRQMEKSQRAYVPVS